MENDPFNHQRVMAEIAGGRKIGFMFTIKELEVLLECVALAEIEVELITKAFKHESIDETLKTIKDKLDAECRHLIHEQALFKENA